MAPRAGAARSRLVRGAALGHLKDGRGNRLLLNSVIGHDGDRQSRGSQSVNRVRKRRLHRSPRCHP
eukprot:4147369-Alexandrium_andersonii.AAC.1